jgi:aspartate/methionine/tyrosine aminotransferase
MKRFIKPEVQAIEISGIRHFNELANQIPGVLKLTLGELDCNTFDSIKDAMHDAIKQNKTRYTPNAGIPALRRHIAEQYEYYSPENVLVTVGTTEAFSIIIHSVIQPGDEVIIPTPGYVGYEPLITLEQGIVTSVDTTKYDGAFTTEMFENVLSKQTKAIILANPNNPTGKVLSLDDMKLIKDFVLKHDLLLIVDEIYSTIILEGSHISFATFEELHQHLLIVNGFSKSHAMTGLRIGYVIGEESIIKELTKTHQYNVTSATSISQFAALKASPHDAQSIVPILRARRNLVLQTLDELGIPYIYPKGAFYVFADISEFNMDSNTFAITLLHEFKVAVIPGSAFLGHHDRYIRISYATDNKILEEALARFKEFVISIRD